MTPSQTPPIANDAPGAHSRHRVDLRRAILDYEIRSSWWVSWISNERLQNLAASYFGWKVRRKWRRWEQSRRAAEWVKAHGTLT